MSRISDLGKEFKNIPTVLAEYEAALEGVEDILNLKGKTLEQANKENPSWQVYYDQKKIELKTVVDYMELQVQRVRGRLFKSYTETYQRDLSDRAKEKYIDHEEKYLTVYEIYLEVKDLYNRYQSVVEGFTARGYALSSITRARVADVQDHLL